MFQTRLKIMAGLVLGMMALLGGRLILLQFFDEAYSPARALASVEREGRWLQTLRGRILDVQGRVVALDIPEYDLCLNYYLTRLYDERFWHYQGQYFAPRGGVLTPEQARAYLRRRDTFDLTGPEAEALVRKLAPAGPIRLERIRAELRARADKLLDEIEAITGTKGAELRAALAEINDDLFLLQAAVARRNYFRRPPPGGNDAAAPPPAYEELQGAALLADFEKQVPDAEQRLGLIYSLDLVEMHQPQPVIRRIAEAVALQVEERLVGYFNDIGGQAVSVEVNRGRFYPYGEAACHVIGTMRKAQVEPVRLGGTPTAENLERPQLGDRVGDWGAEHMFENRLRGRRGWVKEYIDRRPPERIEPINGGDIQLSLDIELQKEIQELFRRPGQVFGPGALGPEAELYRNEIVSGARPMLAGAVLIDVPTGQVRAMVSNPVFNLNTYYQPDEYRRINGLDPNDPARPYREWCNRCLMENFCPGSTIKPTILLAALKLGIVNSSTTWNCDRPSQIAEWNNRPPYCDASHGAVDCVHAIMKSCNLYFMRCGLALGQARIQDWLRQAGFGAAQLCWPEPEAARARAAFRETAGNLFPLYLRPEPPKIRVRETLTGQEIRQMSIGRGVFDGSILQLANSMATIARDGVYVEPTLVINLEVNPASRRIAETAPTRIVREAMLTVVNHEGGTGYKAFHPEGAQVPWPAGVLTVYGKTGSAEDALFACFAEAGDTCLALAVVVDTGLAEVHGSEAAAPLAREILKICGKHGYLP